MAVFFGLLASFCQIQKSSIQRPLSVGEQFEYLPSGVFLKGFALAYDSVFADLLWVKAISYMGEQYVVGHDYSWLYHLLDITTTLDPYFEDPYEFGGVILANEVGDIDRSSKLLRKGMEHVSQAHSRYWYLPFFLAYNYWHYQNDFDSGAKYLEIASRFPQAPAYLPLLTARMYSNISQAELALPFLDEMIKNAKNSDRRWELKQRRKEVIVSRDLDFLDKKIELYAQKINKYPLSLNDLVQHGIIQQIPVEPFNGRYVYDPILHVAYSTLTHRIKLYESKSSK